jgi:hypothetical protein
VHDIRESGATPVLMTFAYHIPPNYSRDAFWAQALSYSNPTQYDPCEVEMWGPPWYVQEAMLRNNEAVRSIAEAGDILLIDQEALMRSAPGWFGDVCHFNDEGTARFIRHIVAFFEQEQLLK